MSTILSSFSAETQKLDREICEIFTSVDCVFERFIFEKSMGNGPWIEYQISTQPADALNVCISLYETGLYINTNRAECRIEIEHFNGIHQEFAEGAKQALQALMSQNSLQIRQRKTWFGYGPLEGAVCLGEYWCGELFCVKGKGKIQNFSNWYKKSK